MIPLSDVVIELHCHTLHSDGVLSVPELLDLAERTGITHLAITDDDSMDAIGEAIGLARGRICVIPGVEISTSYEGRDLHMLGYFLDHESEGLIGLLDSAVKAREDRTRKMVGMLRESGFDISAEWFESTGATFNRSNIARRLVQIGAAPSFDGAFDMYLDEGRPFYVEKSDMPSQEAIEAIHSSGGIAVIAHPAHYHVEDAIPVLAGYGLDGVECYHSEHSREDAERLERLADSLGLLVTGGTDFHGDTVHPGGLASCQPPRSRIESFLEAGRARGFST